MSRRPPKKGKKPGCGIKRVPTLSRIDPMTTPVPINSSTTLPMMSPRFCIPPPFKRSFSRLEDLLPSPLLRPVAGEHQPAHVDPQTDHRLCQFDRAAVPLQDRNLPAHVVEPFLHEGAEPEGGGAAEGDHL